MAITQSDIYDVGSLTQLENHTTSQGAGYTKINAPTIQIFGAQDFCSFQGAGGGLEFPSYELDYEPATQNYAVSFDLGTTAEEFTSTVWGFKMRSIATNSKAFFVGFAGNPTAGSRQLRVLRLSTGGGGNDTVSSVNYNFGDTDIHTVKAEIYDTATTNQMSVKVWVDDVIQVDTTYSDSDLYGSAGRVRIDGAINTTGGILLWDNLVLEEEDGVDVNFSDNLDLSWMGSALINGDVNFSDNLNLAWDGTASVESEIYLAGNLGHSWSGSANVTFDFSFKWSVEHIEASDSHGFPSVYVQVSNIGNPSDTFTDLVNAEAVFERRLLEVPRLQEIQLDERAGLAGFQRVTLQADNSDGLLNGLELQDSFVRIFFVDADGNDYKVFNGKVVDWILSHTVTINVEDLDALAFTQELPKRTLNDLVEAEKEALSVPGMEDELDDFKNSVVADDLGKPIPIIFGRAVKVPLLYVKADETDVMGESKREYDYIIGEGRSSPSIKFQEVFTVYREDKALDEHTFTTDIPGPGPRLIKLPDILRRPDGWYKYWWITALGQNRYVTDYNSSTNIITFSGANVTVPMSTFVELREWQFFNGQQNSPYDGYAFIRFKKRLGNAGSTDQLYADVNGLQNETNRAGAIASILGTVSWGLGASINAQSFLDATAELDDLTCEGAIIDRTSATDILQKLLSYRDMVLFKGEEGTVEISVDKIKETTNHQFGLGDEAGYNNILNQSPSVIFKHPDQKVKYLKVRYRKNQKESDTYLHEFTRSSSSNGVDETIDLPFIYDHTIADKFLDYKRKRLAAADRNLSLDVGEDGKKAKRGNRATVNIPSLGISSDWEVTSANVTPAGSNTINLVPYNANAYTYTSFTSEGGTLPTDEFFDIPPDYTNTPPEPVTGLTVTEQMATIGVTPIYYFEVLWTPPSDGNYGGAIVDFSLHNDNIWEGAGTHQDKTRISQGLVPGQLYDIRVTPLNITGEIKGLAEIEDNMGSGYLVGGDGDDPDPPTALMVKSKFGDLVWEWANSISDDVLYHEIEVYDAESGGNLLDSKKYFQGDKSQHIYKAQSGDLTNTPKPSAYATVQAVDYSGNASGFISPRVGTTTDEIKQPDITDGEITGIWESYVSSSFFNGSSTPILTVNVVGARGGQVLDIDFSATYDPANSTGPSGFRIAYKGKTVYLSGFIELGPGAFHFKALVDSEVGSGAVEVFASPGSSQRELYELNCIVEERRR